MLRDLFQFCCKFEALGRYTKKYLKFQVGHPYNVGGCVLQETHQETQLSSDIASMMVGGGIHDLQCICI